MDNHSSKDLSITDLLKLHWWLFCLGWVTWYNHIRLSLEVAQKIENLYPEHPKMLRKLAGLYLRAERYEDCLDVGLRLVRQRSEDPHAHALVGATCFLLGDLQGQLHHYELAWKSIDNILNPIKRMKGKRQILSGIKQNLLIQKLEGMDSPATSIPQAELDKVKIKPWVLCEMYGEYLFFTGRKDMAFKQFKKEVEIVRWHAYPYMRMGWILAERGEYEGAVNYLRRTLQCFRQRRVRPYTRVWLAYSYFHLGKNRLARYHLWRWQHRELARGGDRDRIRAACIYRALGVLDYLGRNQLRRTFRFSPDPNLLTFLRHIEDELGLERMSIEELGGAQESSDAEDRSGMDDHEEV